MQQTRMQDGGSLEEFLRQAGPVARVLECSLSQDCREDVTKDGGVQLEKLALAIAHRYISLVQLLNECRAA